MSVACSLCVLVVCYDKCNKFKYKYKYINKCIRAIHEYCIINYITV